MPVFSLLASHLHLNFGWNVCIPSWIKYVLCGEEERCCLVIETPLESFVRLRCPAID
jgi:hypothetical protein